MKRINQFTNFTCALDCWSHFLTERGYPISTKEIMTHHKDLCWNNPEPHTYGAIDTHRFKILASRYMWRSEESTSPTKEEIKEKLDLENGVFFHAENHQERPNLRHVSRIVSIKSDELEILNPAFPYGDCITTRLSDLINKWKGVFVYCSFP